MSSDAILDKKKSFKSSDASQIIFGAGVTVAFHPLTYAKVLIQLGHEPLPPYISTTLLGRRKLMFPNVFKYMGHIREKDGFFGMYRGVTPRLLGVFVSSYVTRCVAKCLSPGEEAMNEVETSSADSGAEIDDDEELVGSDFQVFLEKTRNETLSRCAGLIVVHPFHVLMVRSMAQFIGQEMTYTYSLPGFAEIFDKNGLQGFFAGLVPRLLGEVITIWCANSLVYAVQKYMLPPEHIKSLKSSVSMVCTMLVTQFTYPFQVVSNVMAVNDSGLAAAGNGPQDVYSDWIQCYQELQSCGQIKRGSSLFFRFHVPERKRYR